jgi:hypothetical protein
VPHEDPVDMKLLIMKEENKKQTMKAEHVGA